VNREVFYEQGANLTPRGRVDGAGPTVPLSGRIDAIKRWKCPRIHLSSIRIPEENSMPFDHFGLSPQLDRNLRRLGYTDPTPIQQQAIPAVLTGSDLVATAQTGTGKTAAFLLPVLHRMLASPQKGTTALVLAPTRELAHQIGCVFKDMAAETSLRSAIVIGGANFDNQRRLLAQGVDLIIATPGRLLDHLERGYNGLSKLRTLILDEADQMFDLGFFPVLKQIAAKLPKDRQTLLFSATMPQEVERLAKTVVRNPKAIAVGVQGQAADTVEQVAYPVSTGKKTALLRHLLRSWEKPSVLVFTRTRRGCKKLSRELRDHGIRIAELHGDRTPNQRESAMQLFRTGSAKVLVATNVAARGIDVRGVTHVVNYDAPDAPEEYVHRIGRTGRAGEQGESLVLVSPAEEGKLSRVERLVRRRIERRRIDDFNYGAGGEPNMKQPALERGLRPVNQGRNSGKSPQGRWGRRQANGGSARSRRPAGVADA
jgi:ATP-dependent RNA helicase RhlE